MKTETSKLPKTIHSVQLNQLKSKWWEIASTVSIRHPNGTGVEENYKYWNWNKRWKNMLINWIRASIGVVSYIVKHIWHQLEILYWTAKIEECSVIRSFGGDKYIIVGSIRTVWTHFWLLLKLLLAAIHFSPFPYVSTKYIISQFRELYEKLWNEKSKRETMEQPEINKKKLETG